MTKYVYNSSEQLAATDVLFGRRRLGLYGNRLWLRRDGSAELRQGPDRDHYLHHLRCPRPDDRDVGGNRRRLRHAHQPEQRGPRPKKPGE